MDLRGDIALASNILAQQQYHKNDKVWMKKPNEDRKFAMTVEKSQMIPGTTIMEYVLKDLDGKLYKDGEFVPQSWVIGKR